MQQVVPEVYLVAETTLNVPELERYLRDTDNEAFLETIAEAREEGLGDQEILSSFFAKLCYRSLSLGKNSNVTRLRSIKANIVRTIEEAHGSVFEHACFSFMLHNVSRVLTHELVRHRVGDAFSQESGRYCRIDEIGMYLPTCIARDSEATDIFTDAVDYVNQAVHKLYELYDIDEGNFTEKKELTSAIRRIAPNGMANGIGFSVNLRSARNIIKARTNRHAEEEIRVVFAKVATIMEGKCPILFHDAKKEEFKGIMEYDFPHKL